MNYALIVLGCLMAIVGHTVSWFGSNSQFMWTSWKSNPIYSVIIFGIPSNILFWIASRNLFDATHSIWQIRWIMFAMSFPAMLALNNLFFEESFLNTKNLLTLFFAICILITQFYFRGR